MACQPAAAQSPAFNWTGFYIGANAGYGWGEETRSADAGAAFLLFGSIASSASVQPKGALLGGHVGFNVQSGSLLFGVELQGNWADLNVSKNGVDIPIDRWESKLSSLHTATMRVGAVYGKTLAYFKGGYATGDLKSGAFLNDPGSCPVICSFEGKKRYDGWTAGVGFEWMAGPNWSLGLEYNYVDLGSRNLSGLVSGSVVPSTVDVKVEPRIHAVMLRVNFFPR